MPQRTEIVGTDHDGHKVAATMHHKSDTPPGQVVYSERFRELDTYFSPLTNDELGLDMNVDAAFGGTPEVVHNGTDTVDWTGSNIIGNKVVFDDSARPHSGTKSVRVDNPALNDIWQFDKGSDLSVSSYVGITMFINIDKDWSNGDSISLYAYDTGSASTVGVQVLIEDYIDEFMFDVWQSVSIPFADLGIVSTDFDALRMGHPSKGGGKSPKFYLDDIQIEQSGTPSEFKTNTPEGQKFYIKVLRFHIIAALDTTLTDNSMYNLSYDKFLSLASLPNGVLLQRHVNDVVTFSIPITQLSDALGIGFNIKNVYSDGTNTGLVLEQYFEEPLVVFGGENSYLSLTISDDLSSLVSFRAIARGTIEIN